MRGRGPITRRSFLREAFMREDAQGTFPRAAIRARKRIFVHLRAETLRAEKIGTLSDLMRYGYLEMKARPSVER